MTDNLNSFAGKYAIITGSTQGLGEATARLFAERDAAGIIITGRNAERGQAVASDLTAGGCKAHFVQADLGDVESCRKIVAAAADAFGAVHVLVNSAAVTDRGSIWDTTPEFWDFTMAVNVRAPFLLIQDSIKLMKREGNPGSIVNVTSVAAYGSEPFLCAYAASKAALVVLTKNVAYAVMRHHIRANALNLGWMDSPGEHVIQRKYHTDDPNWLAEAEAGQPFGRLIKVDEAARAIAFLASDESGLMTGTAIDYDQSVIGAGEVPKPPEETLRLDEIDYCQWR